MNSRKNQVPPLTFQPVAFGAETAATQAEMEAFCKHVADATRTYIYRHLCETGGVEATHEVDPEALDMLPEGQSYSSH